MKISAALNSASDFYMDVFLHLLKNMNLGNLRITLPDQSQVSFGEGNEIKAEMRILDPAFFKKCFWFGDIGFGESYVDGHWETDSVEKVISWFILNIENAPEISGSKSKRGFLNLLKFINKLGHFKRRNSLEGSKKNIGDHYDLSNDFFRTFLDPGMTYSSGYFTNENETLEQSQNNKYDRLCRILKLKPSDQVLEIGTGWGANAIHIARNYGCKVTTATISKQQFEFVKEKISQEGLADKMDVIFCDYRDIQGSFDKIVSIEMIEAVGAKFLDVYFMKINGLLKKDGLFAFQVISCPDSRFDQLRTGVDWIQKHIFPGSLLPSVGAINDAVKNTSDLTLVDLKEFGMDYAKTLDHWKRNFNFNIDKVKALGFDEAFIRKWNYYFSYCHAAFSMRNINVMQMVYSRPNNLKY